VKVEKPGENQYVKCMIFGPYGRGKTHLLGTAQLDERTYPMLFLDFEGGDQTLAGLDIDMVRIRDWDDYSEVYNEIANSDHRKYKSIGIDSISETHIFALFAILDAEKKARSSKGVNTNLIQQGDYGIAGVQLSRLLREFRDLPYHVFATALDKEVAERREGLVKKAALAGRMANELPAIMDIVGYMSVPIEVKEGGPERVLLLKNYPGYSVKMRTPWVVEDAPDEIEDPTITKLLDIVHIPKPAKQHQQKEEKATA
jgi:hypothetical protein